MEKPVVTNQKIITPDIQKNQEQVVPNLSDVVEKKTVLKNFRIPKIILVAFITVTVFTSIYFSIIYYKRNFTPGSILTRSLGNLIKNNSIKYEGVIKLSFSYANKEEQLNLSDLEIYTLIKRSMSDTHEVVVQGEHFPVIDLNHVLSLSY